MIENSKRADKMWETRNSNINSSDKTENNKSIIEQDEVKHVAKKDADLKIFLIV